MFPGRYSYFLENTFRDDWLMAGPHERHNHKLVSLVSQRLGVVIIVLMAKKSTEGGGGGGGKVGLWEEGVAQSQSEERGGGVGGRW